MLTLVLCALAHGGKALAGEATEFSDLLLAPKPVRPELPALAWPIDAQAPVFTVPASQADFSATEFRPRRRASSARAMTDYGSSDPMFRTTTVWQRLNEFRAQDRVRVLTLWETRASNVSLQAGKKGDPSLQWSSSWTSQGRASHGLLDRLMSASLNGMISRASSARFAPGTGSVAKPLITTAVTPAK
jgi:hypothetical protein